jgi:hypothetical protein
VVPANEVVVAAVAFPNGDLMVATSNQMMGQQRSTILRRVNGTWSSSTPSALAMGAFLSTLQRVSNTEVIAGGSMGTLLRWNGSAWSAFAGPPGTSMMGFTKIRSRSPTDLYVSPGGGPVLYHYNGSAWTEIGVPQGQFGAHRDFAVTPTSVWFTPGGKLYQRPNGMADWIEIKSYVPIPFYGVAVRILALADDDVFVVGSDTLAGGAIVHYDGNRVDPVRAKGSSIYAVIGTPRRIIMSGATSTNLSEIYMLHRSRPWNCRADEAAHCSDGVDNDCDDKRDGDDTDCP